MKMTRVVTVLFGLPQISVQAKIVQLAWREHDFIGMILLQCGWVSNSNLKMIYYSKKTYYYINPQFKEYINEKQHWNVSLYKHIFEHSYFVMSDKNELKFTLNIS